MKIYAFIKVSYPFLLNGSVRSLLIERSPNSLRNYEHKVGWLITAPPFDVVFRLKVKRAL
jgi:hypothetical protein